MAAVIVLFIASNVYRILRASGYLHDLCKLVHTMNITSILAHWLLDRIQSISKTIFPVHTEKLLFSCYFNSYTFFTFTGLLWRAVKQHQLTGKLLWRGFHTRPLKVVRIYSLKLFTAPLYPTLQYNCGVRSWITPQFSGWRPSLVGCSIPVMSLESSCICSCHYDYYS
jgi:hypothetical protein